MNDRFYRLMRFIAGLWLIFAIGFFVLSPKMFISSFLLVWNMDFIPGIASFGDSALCVLTLVIVMSSLTLVFRFVERMGSNETKVD